jgi:hypothetical protein
MVLRLVGLVAVVVLREIITASLIILRILRTSLTLALYQVKQYTAFVVTGAVAWVLTTLAPQVLLV